MSRNISKKLKDQYVENKERDYERKQTIGKGKRFFTYQPTLGLTVPSKCPYCKTISELSREQSCNYMRQLFHTNMDYNNAMKTTCGSCNNDVYGFHS